MVPEMLYEAEETDRVLFIQAVIDGDGDYALREESRVQRLSCMDGEPVCSEHKVDRVEIGLEGEGVEESAF